MKKLTSFFLMCLFAGQAFSQIQPDNSDPFLFRSFTHSGNLKNSENKLQAKSFYQSKDDWQTIIDTTWGPGDPLPVKLAIFNTYTGDLTARFAGFTQLGIDPTEWDSIKDSYRSRINSSTSKGAFAALMGRLAYDLHDGHVRACDTTVLYTKLNPGTPILIIGSIDISHFGAVLTVLPDSSLLVLRTIDEHPLGLQPGDIVLGYEGVPWKNLVDELLGSGIPLLAWSRDAKSALRYHELASAGMNWHLFESIDIVQYASGDTVHLPLYPMVNLPVTDPDWYSLEGPREGLMWNNEQLPIPGVPFPDPDMFNERSVTYGIVEGTNIGYIYLYAEIWEGAAPGLNYNTNDQFYEAVRSLLGTEGLIIDLRINFGGWALFNKAFNLLFNLRQPTLEDAVRCNQTDFSLCPLTDYTGWFSDMKKDPNLFFIPGNPMSWYDKPIAILTGPNCASNGDMAAYRFDYHPMARFFGKSTTAALSYYAEILTYPEWILWCQSAEMYRVNDPDVFLSRREFPVDDSIWFDAESVAAGKDAVVQKAMDWIQNLSYARNIKVNPGYAVPGTGTITLTAQVINPNDHNLSVNAFITRLDSSITDTVSLFDDGNHNDGSAGDGTWGAIWTVPDVKTIFSADITTDDLTAGTSRTITEAVKFTTIGPVVVDEITYTKSEIWENCTQKLYFKVALRNTDLTESANKFQAKLTNLDNLTKIMPDGYYEFPVIGPGETSTGSITWYIYIPQDYPANQTIPFKLEIFNDYYTVRSDTFFIEVRAPLITAQDDTIAYGEITDLNIKSLQTLSGNIYYTYTSAPDNEGAVTGNTSNTTNQGIKVPIQDTLYNTTDQIQKVVYAVTPYLLASDNSVACTGTSITVNIWVDTLKTNVEEISQPMARIYPNPVSELINIEINNTLGQDIEIELLNVSGQLIYRKEYKNSKDFFIKQIDLSGYAKGVYLLRIKKSGEVYNGKIIVM